MRREAKRVNRRSEQQLECDRTRRHVRAGYRQEVGGLGGTEKSSLAVLLSPREGNEPSSSSGNTTMT